MMEELMVIPEGYGLVTPRGRQRARQVLAVAERLGVPYTKIHSQQAGFLAPLAVVDEIEREDSTDDDGAPEGAKQEDLSAEAVEQPKGNASGETWSNWAHAVHGYDPAEELSRDELIKRYGASNPTKEGQS